MTTHIMLRTPRTHRWRRFCLWASGGAFATLATLAAISPTNAHAQATAARASSDLVARDQSSDRPMQKRPTGKLNLNTATGEQLQLLPGIGPAKAERILEWRQKHGAFRRVADLRRVKGFGYRTLKKLERYIDIKGESTLRQGPGP